MLQGTIQRLTGIENLSAPIVICNIEHRFLVAEQLQQMGVHNASIVLEPVGRNTAPAIAAAAHLVAKNHPHSEDDQLLILSADHEIKNVTAFQQTIQIATQQAMRGNLVTFGITPTAPNTGYGYIKVASDRVNPQGNRIDEFVEKPDLETATRYIDSGQYLWNSGMFLFKANQLLEELDKYSPEIVTATQHSVHDAINDLDFVRLEDNHFITSPSESIDYALMEKTDQAVVVPLNAGWSDVGSWSALYDIGEKDENGNLINGDALIEESTRCYIHADYHMIAAIGVEDLVIIDTPDATLVSSRDKVQQVKQIVEKLQTQGRCEQQTHRKVYRPWGWYDTIDNGDRFKVKRICVKPGASLSLQKHYHRAEHWIIVKGTAQITNGDQTELLNENQSTYIPIGTKHRLENPGKLPLEMIEVQSGSYLEEDDIERFEDSYGRER